MSADLGKCSTGLEPKVAGLLCYLVGILSGIIFYLIEKENKFVRFHALQSIIVFGALIVLSFIPLIQIIVPIAGAILWILLMVKAVQGNFFKLPLAGDLAEKHS